MECFEVKFGSVFCFNEKKNKGVVTVHYQKCAEVGLDIDMIAKIFVCHTFFYKSIVLHKQTRQAGPYWPMGRGFRGYGESAEIRTVSTD